MTVVKYSRISLFLSLCYLAQSLQAALVYSKFKPCLSGVYPKTDCFGKSEYISGCFAVELFVFKKTEVISRVEDTIYYVFYRECLI